MADQVGGPDNDHAGEDRAGEIRGSASAQAHRAAQEEKKDVDAPEDKGSQDLGIEEVGCAERCFLDEDGAENEADGHAGKAEEEHGVGEALEGVEGGEPVERHPPGVIAGFALGFEAVFLNEVEDGSQQTKTEGGIGSEQGRDVGDEPAGSNPLRREDVVGQSEGGHENEKEGERQGENAEGDGVVEPPCQEKQAGDGKAKE